MSRATNLIPVILLLLVVAGAAYVGYQMYLYSQALAERGQRSMQKRNISLTADGGMKVAVKELKTEDYSSRTQDMLVKAWNYSSWPEYRSRLWNKDAQKQPVSRSSGVVADGPGSKPAYSRHASSQ